MSHSQNFLRKFWLCSFLGLLCDLHAPRCAPRRIHVLRRTLLLRSHPIHLARHAKANVNDLTAEIAGELTAHNDQRKCHLLRLAKTSIPAFQEEIVHLSLTALVGSILADGGIEVFDERGAGKAGCNGIDTDFPADVFRSTGLGLHISGKALLGELIGFRRLALAEQI